MTATTTPRPTEADCQRTIIEAAKVHGWLVHHARPAQMQSGKWATPIQGHAGFPDLILAHPGRSAVLAVELKRKPNRLEASQERWLRALASAGITSVVVWVPEEMDTFIRDVLGRFKR